MQYAHHEPSDTKSVSRDRICLKMQVNVSKLELSHFKSQGQRKINKVTLSPKNSPAMSLNPTKKIKFRSKRQKHTMS